MNDSWDAFGHGPPWKLWRPGFEAEADDVSWRECEEFLEWKREHDL